MMRLSKREEEGGRNESRDEKAKREKKEEKTEEKKREKERIRQLTPAQKQLLKRRERINPEALAAWAVTR